MGLGLSHGGRRLELELQLGSEGSEGSADFRIDRGVERGCIVCREHC